MASIRNNNLVRRIFLFVLSAWTAWAVIGVSLVLADREGARLSEFSVGAVANSAEHLSNLAVALVRASVGRSQQDSTSLVSRGLMPSPELHQAEKLATRALESRIADPQALAVLGIARAANGEIERARTIMKASDRLSKRDLLTRSWLIQDAAQQGDVEGILVNLDIVLRSSNTVREWAYPALTQLLERDEAVPVLIRLLQRNPNWAESFFYAAVASGQGPPNLARIYLAVDADYERAGQSMSGLILDTLVSRRDYDEAFAFERAISDDPNREMLLRDPNFERAEGVPPFTWELLSDANFDTIRSIGPEGEPVLSIQSSGIANGVVARQLIQLEPGTYRFTGTMANKGGSADLNLEWQLNCVGQEAPIARHDTSSRGASTWRVPAEGEACAQQWIELVASTDGSRGTSSVLISPIRLVRAGN